MANNAKVMSSIKDFLIKLKALDEAIPEELANDALAMTEEVKDALDEECEEKAEDTDPNEGKKTDDEEECEEKVDIDKKVEDAMTKVLKKYGLITDSAMSALDELEKEVKEEDADEDDVTVDPEKMNDSSSVRAMLKIVKPAIASVKDAKTRKILADNFAKAMKFGTGDQYGMVMNISKQAAASMKDSKPETKDTSDFGMEIAKKWNPHYKEEK